MFVLPLSRRPLVRRTAVAPAFGRVIDRLFDESFDRFFGGSSAGADTRTPSLDVRESDTVYTVIFDVPGMSREQLKVSVEGRRVGRAPPPQAEDATPPEALAPVADAKPADRVLYRERTAAAYARTVELPAEVDQASQAKFENGVLTLTLAKKVPAGATQLSIA